MLYVRSSNGATQPAAAEVATVSKHYRSSSSGSFAMIAVFSSFAIERIYSTMEVRGPSEALADAPPPSTGNGKAPITSPKSPEAPSPPRSPIIDGLGFAVVRLATHAISVGAPLYNCGKERECASLYQLTLESLLLHHGVTPQLRELVEEALAKAKSQAGAARRAWTLRAALNAAVDMVASPIESPIPTPPLPKRAERSDTASPTPPSPLMALPEDLLLCILRQVTSAYDLASLMRTSKSLRQFALSQAEAAVRSHRGCRALAGSSSLAPPNWARALLSIERLEAAVGEQPSDRSWWHEWQLLRCEETSITTGREYRASYHTHARPHALHNADTPHPIIAHFSAPSPLPFPSILTPTTPTTHPPLQARRATPTPSPAAATVPSPHYSASTRPASPGCWTPAGR